MKKIDLNIPVIEEVSIYQDVSFVTTFAGYLTNVFLRNDVRLAYVTIKLCHNYISFPSFLTHETSYKPPF